MHAFEYVDRNRISINKNARRIEVIFREISNHVYDPIRHDLLSNNIRLLRLFPGWFSFDSIEIGWLNLYWSNNWISLLKNSNRLPEESIELIIAVGERKDWIISHHRSSRFTFSRWIAVYKKEEEEEDQSSSCVLEEYWFSRNQLFFCLYDEPRHGRYWKSSVFSEREKKKFDLIDNEMKNRLFFVVIIVVVAQRTDVRFFLNDSRNREEKALSLINFQEESIGSTDIFNQVSLKIFELPYAN